MVVIMKKVLLVICPSFLLMGIVIGVLFEKNNSEYIDHPGISILSRINSGIIPDGGFVPDKSTALKIAKAVWLPIYGKRKLMWTKYQVKLENNIWYIESLNMIHLFFGISGGGPFIKIDKNTGEILDVSHTG
jgi:hypothetical protein